MDEMPATQEIHIDDSLQIASTSKKILPGNKKLLWRIRDILRDLYGVRARDIYGRCVLVEIYDMNSISYEMYFKYKDKTKQYLLTSIQ